MTSLLLAYGTTAWLLVAGCAWLDGHPKLGARLILATPIWPAVLCALLGIGLTRGLLAIVRTAR